MDKYNTCVREHIRNFIKENNLNRSQADALYDKCSSIVAVLKSNFDLSKLESAEVDTFVKNLCCYELTCDTYLFKQAMQDFKYTSKKDFYQDKWFSCVTLHLKSSTVEVHLADVYKVCTCPEFYDLRLPIGAKDFVGGDVSEDDVAAFLRIAGAIGIIDSRDMPALPEESDDIFSADSPLFAQLVTADSFKESRIEAQCQKVLDSLLPRIRRNLRDDMFKIECLREAPRCSLVVNDLTENIVERVTELLCEQGFIVHFTPRGNAFVCEVTVCSDSRTYSENLSEEDIIEKLDSAVTGYDFYFVATYCKSVLAPKLTKTLVTDTMQALNNVRIRDDCAKVEKRKTVLPVYENLYTVLQKKNFSVEDCDKYFIVRW